MDVVVPMTIYDKEYKQAIWEYEGVKIRYVRFLNYQEQEDLKILENHYTAL